jgi:tetratricopeptide (TPR) repeat protein
VRACVPALLVCLAAGCAGHRSPDTGSPFVRRSQTTYTDGVTFDAPDSAAGRAAGAGAQAAPTVDPQLLKGPQPKASDSPTLESTNSGLGAALAALKRQRTSSHYVAVGQEYARLGVLDEAESNFESALQMDSRSSDAAEGLARVWRDWDLPQYGLPHAYRAVSFAPRSASAENTLGTLLFALGDLTASQVHFQRALSLDPQAVYALNNLCYVAFMIGDGGPAAARCTEALALAPAETTTRNNLALVYAAEGRADASAAEFAKASAAPAASFNIGIVDMARHEYKEAQEHFDLACHAKPEVVGACTWAIQARKLSAAAIVKSR